MRGRLTEELGYEGLRPSLGPFLSLVWTEPRPLSELAEQLGVSKQACSQSARLAERLGYLERVVGSEDRTQRVRLTQRGRDLVDAAVRMIAEAEADYAGRIGGERLNRFVSASSTLFFDLGIQEQTDPTLSASARRSLGVLPLLAVYIEEALRSATRSRGHAELKLSHARIFALIGRGGARISEMARAQGVSRQAISATARDLESLGYVRRESEASDARGVRVCVSDRGDALMRDAMDALGELEGTFRGILGRRRLADWMSTAERLHRSIEFETVAFGPGALVTAEDRSTRKTRALMEEEEINALAVAIERRLDAADVRRLAQRLLRPRSR